MLERLSDKLDGFLERGVPGYDCAIYHRGKLVYRRIRGFSDREAAVAMKGDESFNVYSCSKLKMSN